MSQTVQRRMSTLLFSTVSFRGGTRTVSHTTGTKVEVIIISDPMGDRTIRYCVNAGGCRTKYVTKRRILNGPTRGLGVKVMGFSGDARGKRLHRGKFQSAILGSSQTGVATSVGIGSAVASTERNAREVLLSGPRVGIVIAFGR